MFIIDMCKFQETSSVQDRGRRQYTHTGRLEENIAAVSATRYTSDRKF